MKEYKTGWNVQTNILFLLLPLAAKCWATFCSYLLIPTMFHKLHFLLFLPPSIIVSTLFPPSTPRLSVPFYWKPWKHNNGRKLALTQDSFFESVPRLEKLLPLLFFHPKGRYQKTRNLPHLPVWAQQCLHGHQGK